MKKSNIITAAKMRIKYYNFMIGFFCCSIVCSCNNNAKNIETQEGELVNQDSLNEIHQNRTDFVSDSIKASLNNTWTIYYSSLKNTGSIQNIEPTDDNGCAFTTIADVETNDGIQISKKRIFKLYKVDSLGSMEWVKIISDWEFPTLTVTKQHNYFIATEKKLQLYDNLGTLQIEKDISSSKMLDNINNAYSFNENEIILIGKLDGKGIIVKLDMQLNIIARHIFGDRPVRNSVFDDDDGKGFSDHSEINSIAKASDGKYYFTGEKKQNLWVGKLNNNLEPIWEKSGEEYRLEGCGLPQKGNTIVCNDENKIFVLSEYFMPYSSCSHEGSVLLNIGSDGQVIWNCFLKGTVYSNGNVNLMAFEPYLLITTSGSFESNKTNFSKLYKVNFNGELINESNINVNGNNILTSKIVSNTNNSFFVLGRNDKKGKNKNIEFSGKSLISKFNSNGKIGENTFDFSEQQANELTIDLDFNNNQQLASFLKIYDFRCSIGNGYTTVLSFSGNNDDVNSGKVQFTMLRLKGMGFDIVSERLYTYTIDKTKSQNRIYFNTNMQGEIYLENDGTLIMNDVSRNERYIYRYSKK